MDRRPNDQHIVEAAAFWAVRLEAGDLATDENIALAEWLRESPRHVEELLLTSTVLAASSGVDPGRRIDVQSLARRASASVTGIGEGTTRPRPTEHAQAGYAGAGRVRYLGLAAAGAMVASLAWFFIGTGVFTGSTDSSQTYVTQLGEQRSLTLPDGSVVHINTQSELRVNYTAGLRSLTLISGEAMFEVAKDAARPFRVLAGETIVQAVGTEFNVYRQPHRTDITVIEGRVAVLPESEVASLSAREPAGLTSEQAADLRPESRRLSGKNRVLLTVGQEAVVGENGRVERISSVDPALRTSWLRRMLVFRNEPLSHVVREFNRYNGLQIYIDDPELARTPLTVALRADNPQALLELLATSKNVVIEHKGAAEIVVRLESPPDAI